MYKSLWKMAENYTITNDIMPERTFQSRNKVLYKTWKECNFSMLIIYFTPYPVLCELVTAEIMHSRYIYIYICFPMVKLDLTWLYFLTGDETCRLLPVIRHEALSVEILWDVLTEKMLYFLLNYSPVVCLCVPFRDLLSTLWNYGKQINETLAWDSAAASQPAGHLSGSEGSLRHLRWERELLGIVGNRMKRASCKRDSLS